MTFWQAVCCRDKAHCCPANTKCDLVHRRCFREDQDGEEPWVEKRLGEPKTGTDIGDASARGVKKTDDVTCKDGQICPDGDTCCLMTNGSYGCCPFSDVSVWFTPSIQHFLVVFCWASKFHADSLGILDNITYNGFFSFGL